MTAVGKLQPAGKQRVRRSARLLVSRQQRLLIVTTACRSSRLDLVINGTSWWLPFVPGVARFGSHRGTAENLMWRENMGLTCARLNWKLSASLSAR